MSTTTTFFASGMLKSIFVAEKSCLFMLIAIVMHYITKYKVGQEHWYRKERITNHLCVASTPQTLRLCWLPSCTHPQSRVLIFLHSFWPYGAEGSQGQCVSQICLHMWPVCVCTYVCICIDGQENKQNLLLVMVFGRRRCWFNQLLHFHISLRILHSAFCG